MERNSIGVFIGGAHTSFPKEIIRGIMEEAEKTDVNVLIFLGLQTKDFLREVFKEHKPAQYDYQFNTFYDYSEISGVNGLVINFGTFGFLLKYSGIQEFAERFNSIPSIYLNDRINLYNCYSIMSDNYKGIRMILEHLVKGCHYKKILYVSGPLGNRDAAERREAYQNVMEELGLEVLPNTIGQGDFTEYIDSVIEELLDENPDAEAIVFANDEMAYAGYRVCQRRGLKIGRDIAITGFDDSELSAGMDPPLTTILQDGKEMGKKAVSSLVQLWNCQSVENAMIEPPVLRARESSGGHRETERKELDIDYSMQRMKEMESMLNKMKRHSFELERRTWAIPFMSKDLSELAEDEGKFVEHVMICLEELNTDGAYLFLLDEPVAYAEDGEWKCPDNLALASYYRNGEIVSYKKEERPHITRENPMSKVMEDGKRHSYMMFLLYSGEMQYGLLACDIKQEEFSFYYIFSIQLGLSLRYLEGRKLETEYRKKLSKSLEEITERNKLLDKMSGNDALTGLLNLRGFDEKLKEYEQSKRGKRAYIIYADLDHLKEINDNWGHVEGDHAIKECGRILSNILRDSDIVARIGGDEYLCVAISDSEQFEASVAARLKKQCEETNCLSDKPYLIEMSVGMTSFIIGADMDMREARAKADRNLYLAKQKRRSSVKK